VRGGGPFLLHSSFPTPYQSSGNLAQADPVYIAVPVVHFLVLIHGLRDPFVRCFCRLRLAISTSGISDPRNSIAIDHGPGTNMLTWLLDELVLMMRLVL
jgi:hypothetical protein